MRKLLPLTALLMALPAAALAASGELMPRPNDLSFVCGKAITAGVTSTGDGRLAVLDASNVRRVFTVSDDQFGLSGAAAGGLGSLNRIAIGYERGSDRARAAMAGDVFTPCWRLESEGRKAYAAAYDAWAADQTLAGGESAWKPKFTKLKPARAAAPKQTEK